jgi:excisionase family DNA binding protein
MQKEYFSTAEVAKILGISTVAVWKKIKEGKLKANRFGRNLMIPKSEMDTLTDGVLDEQKKKMIRDAVKKAVEQYGEALKMLGKE